jgi:uncharacterized protein with NRDE domain
LLDSPWPKVESAKSALSAALASLPDTAPLFALLRDERIPPDDALPQTGVSLEWERLLSSAFVRSPTYGTVSSSVLLRSRAPRTLFEEVQWTPLGEPVGKVRFRLAIS